MALSPERVPGPTARYVAITPARDEVENLRRLARTMLDQTLRPGVWFVVDDGSTDGTLELARELAAAHSWIRALVSPAAEEADGGVSAGRIGGRDIVAFNAGLAALDDRPEFVVKLDADVSLDSDFFERLIGEFEADPTLGIASGNCWEQDASGRWSPRNVTAGHVRGATRMWRWECFEQVAPLEPRLGWDGIDEMKASRRGWRTESLVELPFYHHRIVGARDGSRWRKWTTDGGTAHYLGHRVPFLVLRSVFHATVRREPAAVALLWGYAASALRRRPRCADPGVLACRKREQSLRNVGARVAEVLGHR
jgi:glycosyltransferase involved in cell wall biosynthesis